MRENLWLSLILGEQFAYKWRKHTLICGFLIKEGELPVWIDGNNLFSLAVYASRLSLLLNCSYSLCNLCLLLGRSFSPKKFFFRGPLYLAVRREYKKRTRIKRVRQVDGNDLFSRAVSSQISSTCKSLTFVFGMGTSGTS